MIVAELLSLLGNWRILFAQDRTFQMAVCMALASLCQLGRHTVSQRITLLRRHKEDWNKFYRFFTMRSWEADRLFDVILQRATRFCTNDYFVVGADDTLARKTGSKVHNVGYMRDPLSPKFRYNLVLGLRYLQFSLLLPLYAIYGDEAPKACALPIRFLLAAVPRKPKGRGKNKPTAAEWEKYEKARKEKTISNYFVDSVKSLRSWLDEHGMKRKTLLMVLDNSFCTKTVFGLRIKGVQLLARGAKNYRLYRREGQTGKPEANDGFTPVEVYKDKENHPWAEALIFFGNERKVIKYKEVPDILWPGGAGNRPLRLIVIAATPYRRRKNAQLQYRLPGYLLTTDMKASVEFLIQSYFDRWQIEVNHRDEKTVLGVGQAQVHAQQSVEREPPFAVAAYSLLKLASLLALGPTRTTGYQELPAWYAGSRRPSCEDMVQKLRKEACEHPELLAPYGLCITPEALVTASRA